MWTIIILGITLYILYRGFQWMLSILKKLHEDYYGVKPATPEEMSSCKGVTIYANEHTLPPLVYSHTGEYEQKKNRIMAYFGLGALAICLLSASMIFRVQYVSSQEGQQTQVSVVDKEIFLKDARKNIAKAQANFDMLKQRSKELDAQIAENSRVISAKEPMVSLAKKVLELQNQNKTK